MSTLMSHAIKLSACVVALAITSTMIIGTAQASSSKATVKASQNSKCALTYAAFEAAIAHIDMDHCPGKEDSDKVFCRAKTGHDEIIVFKFSSEGDQCLLKTRSYDEDHFNLTIFDLVIEKDE